MKVLDDNNYIRATCGKCRSTLGVHQGDIEFHEIPHRTSSFTAKCGACGATVNIPQASIPRTWIDAIAPSDG